jgi:hypothetical protein
LFSCARDQQLVTISVIPETEIFGASNIPLSADAGLSVQLRAGRYIHPPVTEDITNQVTWVQRCSDGRRKLNGGDYGNRLRLRKYEYFGHRPDEQHCWQSSSAIVTGSMMANVVCFTGTTSPFERYPGRKYLISKRHGHQHSVRD